MASGQKIYPRVHGKLLKKLSARSVPLSMRPGHEVAVIGTGTTAVVLWLSLL